MMTPRERQAGYLIGIAQAIHQRDETARKAQIVIRDANQATAERDRFRQLVAEAVPLLDPTDPDYEQIDLRDWLKAAKTALGDRF